METACLVNMVSGADIILRHSDIFGWKFANVVFPIHFDFHSLTLGTDKEFKRFRRPLTDWRRWCFMLNSIQMSEEEALGLSAERYDEKTLTNHLMTLMVETLLITRGKRGLTVIVQDIHKKLTHKKTLKVLLTATVETTGCVMYSVQHFLYQYLKSKDSFIAAEFANKTAALNATFKNTKELEGLRSNLEQRGVILLKTPTNGKNTQRLSVAGESGTMILKDRIELFYPQDIDKIDRHEAFQNLQ